MLCLVWQNNIGLFFALGYDMEHRTVSKCKIVYSCRGQNRDNFRAVFSGVYALKVIMEHRITSKGRIEQMFPEILSA